MKLKFISVLLVALALVTFSPSNACATPHPLPPSVFDPASIVGNIDFAGAVHLNNNNLSLATQVLTWFSINNVAGDTSVAPGSTGSFSGIAGGTLATMAQPWTFTGGPQPALWSVGGFTFDLLTVHVVTQTTTFLNVLGTGTVSGNGFATTDATWSFTVSDSNGGNHGLFSFASDANSVPDGGLAVALFGVAFCALGIARRFMMS